MGNQHSHHQNNTNVTQWAKQVHKGSEGKKKKHKAGGLASNKGGSGRGRKTGRYAKGFSMFNFQIGLSRMTFS